MHVTIPFERLASGQGEREVNLTNGVKGVSLRISNPTRPHEWGMDLPLSPTMAEMLAYDLLCKAYNARHGIHDNSVDSRGQGPDKHNLTIDELLAVFDDGVLE